MGTKFVFVRTMRMVLVAALLLLASLTVVSVVSAQDEVSAPPAWMLGAETPSYAPSQYTGVLTEKDITPCQDEPVGTCWHAQITKVVDGEEVFVQFPFKNSLACKIHGYRLDAASRKMVTGIPPGETFWVEGVTHRLDDCKAAKAANPKPEVKAVSAASTAATTSQVTMTFPVTAVVQTDDGKKANVRSGAGLTYTVPAQLTSGTIVTVTSEKEGWFAIQEPKGYVWGELLNFNGETVSSSASLPTVAAPPCVKAPAGLKWTVAGPGVWTYNVYSDADGEPVMMEVDRKQDGEYLDESGEAHTGIPQGKHLVTGITARCD